MHLLTDGPPTPLPLLQQAVQRIPKKLEQPPCSIGWKGEAHPTCAPTEIPTDECDQCPKQKSFRLRRISCELSHPRHQSREHQRPDPEHRPNRKPRRQTNPPPPSPTSPAPFRARACPPQAGASLFLPNEPKRKPEGKSAARPNRPRPGDPFVPPCLRAFVP